MSTATDKENLVIENTQQPGMYAEMIIPYALPKNYTWSVPIHLHGNIQPGIRAEVELKNKKYTAIVKNIFSQKARRL